MRVACFPTERKSIATRNPSLSHGLRRSRRFLPSGRDEVHFGVIFSCLLRSRDLCSDVHCGGWPRFAGRRSSCLRPKNWVRFAVLRPILATGFIADEPCVDRPVSLAAHNFRWSRLARMRVGPQVRGYGEGINPLSLPPGPLVAAAVELSMVQPADGHGEAVA